MKRTIEITVRPDGQTQVETHGFVGPDCQTASRFLERALGQTTSETFKPEFHQTSSSQNTLRQSE